jgi:hypothetical protein
VRIKLVDDEIARRLHDHLLLIVQGEIHARSPWI